MIWTVLRVCVCKVSLRVAYVVLMRRSGVILVDLPGNMDSNAARSAIAEKISKDLAVSVVVANINRGISEKNVRLLLHN